MKYAIKHGFEKLVCITVLAVCVFSVTTLTAQNKNANLAREYKWQVFSHTGSQSTGLRLLKTENGVTVFEDKRGMKRIYQGNFYAVEAVMGGGNDGN